MSSFLCPTCGEPVIVEPGYCGTISRIHKGEIWVGECGKRWEPPSDEELAKAEYERTFSSKDMDPADKLTYLIDHRNEFFDVEYNIMLKLALQEFYKMYPTTILEELWR